MPAHSATRLPVMNASSFVTPLARQLAAYLIAPALALAAVPCAAQIVEHDAVRCEAVPKDQKRPQMELQRKLVAEGWRVRQVKDFNDCYEVYGFDEKGQRTEAFFDPRSFDLIGRTRSQ